MIQPIFDIITLFGSSDILPLIVTSIGVSCVFACALSLVGGLFNV